MIKADVSDAFPLNLTFDKVSEVPSLSQKASLCAGILADDAPGDCARSRFTREGLSKTARAAAKGGSVMRVKEIIGISLQS